MNAFVEFTKLLSVSQRRSFLLIIALTCGLAVFEALSIFSLLPFFAILSSPEAFFADPRFSEIVEIGGRFGLRDERDYLIGLSIFSLTFVVLTGAYRSFNQYLTSLFVENFRHSLSRRVLASILKSKYEFFINKNSADLATIVLSDIERFSDLVVKPIFKIIGGGLVFAFIVFGLLILNVQIALITIFCFGLLYTSVILWVKNNLSIRGAARSANNSQMFMAVSEVFCGIKELKLLGRHSVYLEKFDSASKSFAEHQASYQLLSSIPNYAIETVIFSLLVSGTLVFSLMHGGNTLTGVLPEIGALAFAIYRLKPCVQNLYNGYAGFKYAESVMRSVIGFLPVDMTRADKFPKQSLHRFQLTEAIRFENVSFSFTDAAEPALKNISLDISVGEVVGIVGASGAGKSTLIDVLMGLAQVSRGQVWLDEKKLDLDNEELVTGWQKSIGYVPQRVFIADKSIGENIALGVPIEQIDIAKLNECAEIAQLSEFVGSSPEGFGAGVGEKGARLSGGQILRIGIARALYNDPEILILDEGTSALDGNTEKKVVAALNKLRRSLTTIMIAHNLTALKHCDRLIVMDDGQVVGDGSWQTLERDCGLFRSFSERYRQPSD